MSCLPAALEALTHGGCMERASFLQDSDSQPIASLPVYVAHAGRLRRRRRFVRAQLRALGAPDVTMVLCADAEEVARLTVTQRRCLHPDYARTRWSPTSGTLLCRKYTRCGWPAPPERLVGRGWPEPGVAWVLLGCDLALKEASRELACRRLAQLGFDVFRHALERDAQPRAQASARALGHIPAAAAGCAGRRGRRAPGARSVAAARAVSRTC